MFRTGQEVSESGIYKVHHKAHRLPHEVTLLSGHHFPRCAQCGEEVQFDLVRAATVESNAHSFAVNLFQLPSLDDSTAA